ncbi:hypothetical protein [Hymenobacter sp.]|jgi:hypothetical protein|uniref:hypothetical protein n=1 Tax=Hymenobacter sp. TaxID=1898978 RepID=UPI002EDB6BFF
MFCLRLLWWPAGAVLLALQLGACGSPDTSGASSGDVPFAADSRASDPNTAADRLAANPNVPDSLHLLSPGRAGRLRLNMTEKELLRRVPAAQLKRTTYQDQGQTYPAYEMLDAQKPDAPATVLHLRPDSTGTSRLRRIRIYDPQYRTGEGIGVGSPFGAASQNLGLTRVRNTPAGFAGVSGLVNMAWVIDPNSLPNKHPDEMKPSDIPQAARITGVLLYQ